MRRVQTVAGHVDDPASMVRDDEGYARLVEACPDIIYRLSVRPTVRIDYINPACERIWGYPREEVIGQGFAFLQSLLVDDADKADIADVSAGRKFYPSTLRRYRRKDGAIIWGEVHSVPVYDDTGALIAQHGTIRDVTEREEALNGSRASENRLRRITEWLPDLMMKLDQAGIFTEHLTTGSKQPGGFFLGRNLFELLGEDDQVLARRTVIGAYAGAPGSFRGRLEVLWSEVTYEFRMVPTGDEYLIAMLRDVTGEAGALVRADGTRHEKRGWEAGVHNPYSLTFRELAVLQLVVQGVSDKEIARELGIAVSTANNHVSSILGKMHAGSRTEAGMRAIREGLIAPVST